MGCPHKSASQEVQALPGNTVRKVWLGEWNPVSGCNILPNAPGGGVVGWWGGAGWGPLSEAEDCFELHI